MSEIKAVIFDLGETILNYGRVDVSQLFRAGARLTYDYLAEQVGGFSQRIGFGRYYLNHVIHLRWHVIKSNLINREFDCLALLERLLRRSGIEVDRATLDELAWLWYRPLGDFARVEPDLSRTLERLRNDSLQLTILSNTFLPGSVLDRQLAKYDLLNFFEHRFYSSETVLRKPKAGVFQLVLERLGVAAHEAVMVGDSVRMDIKGAQRCGLKPVFKRGAVNGRQRVPEGVAVLERLSELPEMIRQWPG